MSKYIVCPDSFKGSATAAAAAKAIAKGIRAKHPDASICLLPIADGGEGTLEALVPPENRIRKTVTGTGGSPVEAEYGFLPGVAVIEMARAAGLCLLPESRRDPETATTYGVGELILDALDRGFRKLLITVGGSGTNDGGSGMLTALGARFYDQDDTPLVMCGGRLGAVARIDLAGLDARLCETEITFATDVTNPLLGARGATMVFGPQKGADRAMLARLETGMCHFAKMLFQASVTQNGKTGTGNSGFATDLSGKEPWQTPGCGAGGGLAFPLVTCYGAKIESGISAVLHAVHFDKHLADATLVVTGEGKMDGQSADGKAISGVAAAAKAAGVPVLALVGVLGEGAEKMYDMGVTRAAAISEIAPSMEESVRNAPEYLAKLAELLI